MKDSLIWRNSKPSFFLRKTFCSNLLFSSFPPDSPGVWNSLRVFVWANKKWLRRDFLDERQNWGSSRGKRKRKRKKQILKIHLSIHFSWDGKKSCRHKFSFFLFSFTIFFFLISDKLDSGKVRVLLTADSFFPLPTKVASSLKTLRV